MDGDAIAVGLASSPGPDCLKDVSVSRQLSTSTYYRPLPIQLSTTIYKISTRKINGKRPRFVWKRSVAVVFLLVSFVSALICAFDS